MTLADFLLARIAEDEATASEKHDIDCERVPYLTTGEQYEGEPIRWHSVRGDCDCGYPARVLAECEAKRRIVKLHAVSTTREWVNPTDGPAYQEDEQACAICGWVPNACDTLRLLALPYADHPEYREEEWRP